MVDYVIIDLVNINQINNNVINQADLSSVQVDVVGGEDEVTDMAVVFDKAQSILNNNHAITESYMHLLEPMINLLG